MADKKYIVDVLRIQGLGKKTYVAGEVVTHRCFPKGNIEKLIKEGYVRSQTAAEVKAEAAAEKAAAEKAAAEKAAAEKAAAEKAAAEKK